MAHSGWQVRCAGCMRKSLGSSELAVKDIENAWRAMTFLYKTVRALYDVNLPAQMMAVVKEESEHTWATFTGMHDKGTAAGELEDSLFVPNEMANRDGIYPS